MPDTPGQLLDATLATKASAADYALLVRTVGDLSASLSSELAALGKRVAVLEAKGGTTPPPPPPDTGTGNPPLSTGKVTRKIASSKPSGDGLTIRSAQTIRDLHVENYSQNIHVNCDGSVTLENVRSVHAHRDKQGWDFVGQGIYIERSGPVTLNGCVFAFNGVRNGNATAYWHGVYQDKEGGFVTATDCIFAGNASCGVQLRNGGILRNCLILDNAIGVAAVKGDIQLHDCVFYDGHHYAETDNDGNVKAWTAMTAVQTYTRVVMRNCLLAGRPNQAAPRAPRSYEMGCINNGGGHRDNPNGRGEVDAQGCTIKGWPGKAFDGGYPHNGSGFTVSASPVFFDWKQMLADVLAERMGVKAMINAVRGAVK